jgi:broad specificity phosphatase PhoE
MNTEIKMVKVYVIRHGKALTGAKGDKLLPEGIKQVFKSTVNNLFDIPFQSFFSSLRHRAHQTAVYAALALGEEGVTIHHRKGFDYPDSLIEECGGGEVMNQAAKDLATARGNAVVTIQDWMDAVSLWTGTMRDQVSKEIRRIAIEEAMKNELTEINLLVAAHSPLSETAALDMAAMPRLSEADIVKYTIKVTLDDYPNAEIVASEYIPRGF